jgi:hypothetical protein
MNEESLQLLERRMQLGLPDKPRPESAEKPIQLSAAELVWLVDESRTDDPALRKAADFARKLLLNTPVYTPRRALAALLDLVAQRSRPQPAEAATDVEPAEEEPPHVLPFELPG